MQPESNSTKLIPTASGTCLALPSVPSPVAATPPIHSTPSPAAQRSLERTIDFATRHFSEALTLALLARAARLPCSSLTRHFKIHFGMSPMRWLWTFRIHLAAEMINHAPEWRLADIALACGFGHGGHFSRKFFQVLHQSPSCWRARARQLQRSMPPDSSIPTTFIKSNPLIINCALNRTKPTPPP